MSALALAQHVDVGRQQGWRAVDIVAVTGNLAAVIILSMGAWKGLFYLKRDGAILKLVLEGVWGGGKDMIGTGRWPLTAAGTHAAAQRLPVLPCSGIQQFKICRVIVVQSWHLPGAWWIWLGL
jgi:hypothetical protein